MPFIEHSRPAAATRIPLPSLISMAIVAFTIEADNEFEQRIPHRTTWGPAATSRAGPWLMSLAMWANFLQYVGDEGITVKALTERTRVRKLPLDGMRRWGYVTISPDRADGRPKPPESALVVRPTPAGVRARALWPLIIAEVESRWQSRFGADVVGRLCETLASVVADECLPPFLPVLGYGLRSYDQDETFAKSDPAAPDTHLYALLAGALLIFTREFERDSAVSLAICANVLRVVGDSPIAIAELPRLTGVAKETVAVATGWLLRHGFAILEAASAGARGKRLLLNDKGVAAHHAYLRRRDAIELGWSERHGDSLVGALRDSLTAIVGDGSAEHSPLFAGLEPPPNSWRATIRRPETLPHYPAVTHRGGYPDGS